MIKGKKQYNISGQTSAARALQAWLQSHLHQGSVGPMGAIAIGVASGVGCYIAATTIKRLAGYDDSLDAFGVHRVGGVMVRC